METNKRTSEKEQEESRLREKQTKEPNCDSDTIREQGRERNIEKVYEEHLKEEKEVRMRILKKKEQLLDLKLRLFGRKIDIDE